eukprot:TRINITY_DN8962_c0_g4_i1.p1 TRINITY_DN8962_c0_g4~~TRINITY_DN8962_c0_g4_i1.p1  ORF type:complete len:524 (+),score=133.92 TRINITY_DN8962_c0_g4_i1:199-1572(+)
MASCDAFPDGCCVPGDDHTYEGRLDTVECNAFQGPEGRAGGSEFVPDTAPIDEWIDVPGARGNSAGAAVWEALRDPTHFDFRPMTGTYLAGAGTGAYAGGLGHGAHYWIPGRQAAAASFPIPAVAAEVTPVAVSAARPVGGGYDVMFLQGRGAAAHRVYAGVAGAGSLALLGTLSGDANVYTLPGSLGVAAGAEVHWRVDAVAADGTVREGEVWNFRVKAGAPRPARHPATCETFEDTTEHTFGAGDRLHSDNLQLPALSGVWADRRRVTALRVCLNLTTESTLGDFHTRAVFSYGDGASHFAMLDHWNNPDSSADRYDYICFGDGGAAPLPKSDGGVWAAAAPFTSALYAPVNPILASFRAAPFTDAHVLEKTLIRAKLLSFDQNPGDGHGATLHAWKVERCHEPYGVATDPATWPVCSGTPPPTEWTLIVDEGAAGRGSGYSLSLPFAFLFLLLY